MEGVAVESSAAPGARRRHGRPPFSERNRIVPDALTYHLRRLGSRLHRARITLHGKGLHGFLRRALQGASPGTVAPAGPRPATAPRQPAPGGKRILLVDTTTPRPDRDSGSLRAFNLMRLLLEEGHAVDFLPDDRADAGRYTDDLRALGVTVHCGPDAGGHLAWFRRHLPGFDALIVSRYHLGEFLIPLARTVAPRVRVVLDTVDLHFLREQREAELRGDRTLARLARATRARELRAISEADVAWVVSGAERELLRGLLPAARVLVLPNIHAIAGEVPPREGRSGLLFVGGAGHPPNVDAINWMLDEILPRVREVLPGCVFHVAGDGTRGVVGDRACPHVVAHGHVPDLAPLLASCRAGVAPLRFGAGVKGKVNQYMAHGLPAVVTTCAAEGMHLRDGEDALVANDAESFAAAVARLLTDDALWDRLSANGIANVRRHFSFDAARATLAATFAGDT